MKRLREYTKYIDDIQKEGRVYVLFLKDRYVSSITGCGAIIEDSIEDLLETIDGGIYE